MTAFTVWKFDDPDGAAQAAKNLEIAARDGLVTLVDHAVVSWPEGADQPDTRQVRDDRRKGAGWGTLWGLLGGALFTIPVIGAVVGAGIGALVKATEGTGITKDDLERIRLEIVPGTSALFLVTEDADFDRLGERIRMRNSPLISTNLTDEEKKILLENFGGA
ncbi:MAG: DUF1269 domain-containing protein [Propionicimonas sp.]|nr:DUF1269 domain-containing protein [Propionicimonas sp.]